MDTATKVLVVDDDRPLAELIVEHFEKEFSQLNGEVATSVSEGFELFQEGDYDAIVSDYDFKGEPENGLDFLEQVRLVNEDFPFILFTGKGGEEIAERATTNGVTTYIRKQTGVSQYSVLANTVLQAIKGYQAQIENHRKVGALEEASEGICILNESGQFEYANKAYLQMYGYDKESLIGNDWSELHPDEEVERFQNEILSVIREEGKWKGESIGIRNDGEKFKERKSISPLDYGGLVIVTSDVSEENTFEEEYDTDIEKTVSD